MIVGIAVGAAGCHNLRSQLSALTGSSTSTAAPTDASGPRPKTFELYKGPKPVLDGSTRLRRIPTALDPGRGVSAPRFDWTAHGGQLGGAFGDGSGARRQRGDR